MSFARRPIRQGPVWNLSTRIAPEDAGKSCPSHRLGVSLGLVVDQEVYVFGVRRIPCCVVNNLERDRSSAGTPLNYSPADGIRRVTRGALKDRKRSTERRGWRHRIAAHSSFCHRAAVRGLDAQHPR